MSQLVCEFNIRDHCTGEDVRRVFMKIRRQRKPGQSHGNIYGGPIKCICKGCRGAENGQFKFAD
jgi:hypothetical protein